MKNSFTKKIYLGLTMLLCLAVQKAYTQDSIPGVLQQPQWFIPIYFEDGNGDKDTVYLGYDEDGTQGFDTLFEEMTFIDTTKFNVNFLILNNTDSALKMNIHNNWDTAFNNGGSYNLRFHKGVYPLKVSWGQGKLNSPDLPLNEVPGFPKAKIFIDQMNCTPSVMPGGLSFCPWDDGFSLVDTIINVSNQYFNTYVYLDSFIVDNYANESIEEGGGEWGVAITNYKEHLLSSIKDLSETNINIYPNPTNGEITIDTEKDISQIVVLDMVGNILKTKQNSKLISIANVSSGMYILQIRIQDIIYQTKIIKQ